MNRNFAYLDHVQKEFTKLYSKGRIKGARAYAMDKNFKPNMRSAMHHYNVNHDTMGRDDQVKDLLVQVQDLKSVMGKNINMVLAQGEDLEKLVEKSNWLQNDAKVFKKRSSVVLARQRRKYRVKFLIYIGISVTVATVLIVLGMVGICGVGLEQCRQKIENVQEDMGGGGGGGGKV